MQGNIFTGLFHQIITFRKYNITPIYVFDGEYTIEKTKTIENRKKVRDELLKKYTELEKQIDKSDKNAMKELFKMKNKLFYIDTACINYCKELFDCLGVPYILSNCEADIVCAYLSINDYVYGCLSEDFDLLTFGCKRLIKNLKNETVTIYTLYSLLPELKMNSLDQFQDLCILCGCDYLDSLPKIGPMTAYSLIIKYNSIKNILENCFYKNELEKTKIIKYEYPINYDYNSAKILFLKPDNYKLNENINLDYKKINLENFLLFLKENNFLEKKIISIKQKLKIYL